MASYDFDFQRYVDKQKSRLGTPTESDEFGDYAFSGDVRVLRKLDRAKPVKVIAQNEIDHAGHGFASPQWTVRAADDFYSLDVIAREIGEIKTIGRRQIVCFDAIDEDEHVVDEARERPAS